LEALAMPFLQLPVNNCILYSHTMQGIMAHMASLVANEKCEFLLIWDGKTGEMKTRSMNLADILTGSSNILPDMQAADRWAAIDDLVGNLIATGRIKEENRDAILAVVKKRESSMSTGIGFGIGIPHASTDLIPEVVGALGRSSKGINFDALDNQPVNLVMLFLVPQGQFQRHLHTLASIAKLLHIKEFRQELEQAPDSEAMWQVILKYSAPR
jgi:mannitol/fructose-specific phosphotransferase system IIA component (Ntr-type)